MSRPEMKIVRRKRLPSGTFTSHGYPSLKAIDACFLYIMLTPKDFDDSRHLFEPAIKVIREYFGWNEDNGVDTMILWGKNIACATSTTSRVVARAMSTAYIIAQGMVGQGVLIPNEVTAIMKRIMEDQYRIAV